MKTFIQKVLVVMLAIFIMSLLVKGIIQVGDTTIYQNDIQILYDLDYPQAQLNNHTLREVFDGGNLITNGNFDTNVTGWLGQGGTNSWLSGGFLQSLGSGTVSFVLVYRDNGVVPLSTDNIYQVHRFRVRDSLVTNIKIVYDGSTGGTDKIVYTLNSPLQNEWYNISVKNTFPSDATGLNRTKIERNYLNTINANGSIMEIDYVFSINMTSLGISSLTVAQMDYWFNIYQTLKALEV